MEKPVQVAGLDLQPAEGGYIVYQPEQDQVHYLSPSAVVVLQFCDGVNTTSEVVHEVIAAYAEAGGMAAAAVCSAIQELATAGLIRYQEE